MEAGEVSHLLGLLTGGGVEVWIDGGWGVDALVGEQVREHDDLDLVAVRSQMSELARALRSAGYTQVAGGSPMSVVFVDVDGRQVDVHPVLFDKERGGGVYLMDDGNEWVYPEWALSGEGVVEGRPVRCLSPAGQVLVHDGYELTEKDYGELELLHKRFGVTIPARAAATQMRSPRRAG
jgi:lincosamide nucleotidyltransferase A/C/D/E